MMENIIDKLFEMSFNAEEFFVGEINKDTHKKEWELYMALHEKLLLEDKKMFSTYANLCNERHKEEILMAYKHGFKTAINMILESIKQ